jgi:hypothetical protein
VRHGRIHLNEPYQTRNDSPESLLDKINIKPEEYEIYMTGILGVFNVMRKKVLLFVSRPVYDNSMLLIVLINTVIMSMNGLVDTDQSPYSDMNTIFTYVFAVDLFLKIFAYGIGFFTDVMNLFDTLVVGISIVELSFGSGGSNLSALRAVRILRAFRVLRITRLIRSLSYMRIVMSVVSSIITEFVYIFMLLALFMFIYTLLGMQIFGGQFMPESVTGVRQSFDTFFDAFFSVFQVLTVENWNDI